MSEAVDDGPLLTVQNPADMVGETVIDCRPSVLPVSIPLSALSPRTVADARGISSVKPSQETGQSIMDMDTSEITINRIVGFQWDDPGTDVEDEMPAPALSPIQNVAPVIPPTETADNPLYAAGMGGGEARSGEARRKLCNYLAPSCRGTSPGTKRKLIRGGGSAARISYGTRPKDPGVGRVQLIFFRDVAVMRPVSQPTLLSGGLRSGEVRVSAVSADVDRKRLASRPTLLGLSP